VPAASPDPRGNKGLKGCADDFLGLVAETPFRRTIPARHAAGDIDCIDGNVSGTEQYTNDLGIGKRRRYVITPAVRGSRHVASVRKLRTTSRVSQELPATGMIVRFAD